MLTDEVEMRHSWTLLNKGLGTIGTPHLMFLVASALNEAQRDRLVSTDPRHISPPQSGGGAGCVESCWRQGYIELLLFKVHQCR